MVKFISKLVIFSVAILLLNCKNTPSSIDKAAPAKTLHVGNPLKYDLDKPDNIFSLERDLREISGLTYSATFGRLLAINDEKGYVYLLDPSTAKIQGRIDFGKSNDYEGVAYYNGLIYIVESNGDIVTVDEESENRVDKYNTELSRKNDIEGLVYNTETSTFLLAAKGKGGQKGGGKSIFNLDPITKSISEQPYFSVDLVPAVKKLNSQNTSKPSILTNYEISRAKKFSPSGIAVHQVSNDIYVLSSRGKLLAIFDQKGTLKAVHFLDTQMYAQPEGICFGPDHTLYISNEGRAGKGKIFTFSLKA